MRYRRVLLVYPTYQGSFYEEPQPNPPVGLGYIAESLYRNGVQCSVLDMTLGYGTDTVIQQIQAQGIDLVGISMMSFRYIITYQMIERIRLACPSVAVVIGGAHPCSWKQKVLRDCPSADFAIVGEGENTIVELCQGKPFNEIKGLIFRDGGHIIYVGPRDFISDLGTLPFPRYEQFELKKYREMSITTSRGCPFKCIYCQSHLVLGRQWRPRSAVNVVAELEYWYRSGYRLFNITEDNFAFNKERVYAICDGIQRRGLTGIQLNMGGLRADSLDRDLLTRMRDTGFFALGFGVEGGNDKILRILKKGETMNTIREAIKNACDLGFIVKLYFIVGSPYETWTDFMDSIRIAEAYPVDAVNFYSMMPIPNTELFEWVKREGTLLKSPDTFLNKDTPWSREPFFDGSGMTLEEKRKALSLGLKTRRKIAAKKLLGKRFGFIGIKLAELVHNSHLLYHVIYGSRGVKYLLRHMMSASSGVRR